MGYNSLSVLCVGITEKRKKEASVGSLSLIPGLGIMFKVGIIALGLGQSDESESQEGFFFRNSGNSGKSLIFLFWLMIKLEPRLVFLSH